MLISRKNLLLLVESFLIEEQDETEKDDQGLGLEDFETQIKDPNGKVVGKLELINPPNSNKIDAFISKPDPNSQKIKLSSPEEIKTAIFGGLNNEISNKNGEPEKRKQAKQWYDTLLKGGFEKAKQTAKHRYNLKTADLAKLIKQKLA